MVIIRWVVGFLLLFVFTIFAFVVWLALQEDVVTEDGNPPLIKAENKVLKEEPAERGGIAVMNEDSSLVQALDRGPDEDVVERILPAPGQAPKSASEVLPKSVAEAPREDTATAAQEPAGIQAEVQGPVETPEPIEPEPINPEPVEALVSSEPDPTVAPIDTVTAAIEPEPVRIEIPVPAEPEPVVSVVEPPAPPATPQPASELPRVIAGPAPQGEGGIVTFDNAASGTVAAPAPVVPTRTAPEIDLFRVQLSALREEAQALLAWNQLRDQFPAILDDDQRFIVPSQTDRGLFYRVQAGLYGSREDAQEACLAIKGQGGDCFVVRSPN